MRRFHLRFRVRVRALLVLVMLIAVALSAERMHRLRVLYLSKAKYHAEQEARARDAALWYLGEVEFFRALKVDANDPEFQHRQKELVEKRVLGRYHATLRARYEYAARSPWLSVPLDPPNPDPEPKWTREEWGWLRERYFWLPAEPWEGFYPDDDDLKTRTPDVLDANGVETRGVGPALAGGGLDSDIKAALESFLAKDHNRTQSDRMP